MKFYTNAELRALSHDQLNALIGELMDEAERLHANRRAATQTTTPPTAPQPAPATTPVAKLPRKVRKAVEQFDAMTDDDQVAELRKAGW